MNPGFVTSARTKRLLAQVLGVTVLAVSLGACDIFSPKPSTPGVSSVAPTNGATNVGTSSNVRATLNLPGSGQLNVTTLTDQAVSLTDAAGAVVPAMRTMEGNTLVLDPAADLAKMTSYTFEVTSDVQTADGTSLAPFTSTFTTGTGSDPSTGGSLAAKPAQVLFTAGGSTSSDTRTLTLTNGGSKTISVSSLSISGADAAQFSLSDTGAFSLEPGASRDLSLRFTKSGNGPKLATLSVQSDDTTAPNLSVPLGGLGVAGQGGNNEPSLQWILDTYRLPIQTGDQDPSTTNLVDSPMNGLVGQEVVGQTFTKASPTAPVTAEVLATFGVENDPVLDFGYYAAGNKGAQTEIFSIEQTPTLNAQRLAPVVTAAGQGTVNGDTVTFDPGTESFGLYSSWLGNKFFSAREVFTEDRLNTFTNALPHHVRVYPLPGEANAYVVATDEFNNGKGNDYNDIVVIVRNVVPGEATEETPTIPIPPVPNTPPADGIAGLKVSNASGLPYSDRLVLQKIENAKGKFCDPVKNPGCDPTVDKWANIEFPTTGTVNLQNTGGSALQLSLSFQNDNLFVFPEGESTLTLQPGQTYELEVEFNPVDYDAKGVYPAGLLIQSGTQSAGLQLAGLYQLRPEGSREVQLGPLVTQLFGYNIDLGTTSSGKLASPDANSPLAGDEVRSDTWEAADSGSPVTALQIAAFHDCCGQSYALELHNPGSSSAFASMKPVGVYGQSIYPRKSVNGPLTELSANPSGPFEIYSAGYSSAPGEGKNKGGRLGVRLWPLKDRSGNTVPNAYLVAQDFVLSACNSSPTDPDDPGGDSDSVVTGDSDIGYEGLSPMQSAIIANCDYQDNVYIIRNVKPVN